MSANNSESLTVGETSYRYYSIADFKGVERLPYSLSILLENVVRNARTEDEAKLYAQRIIDAGLNGKAGEEIEFAPARVLFQDFTGVPVFVDFAVMRDACVELGGDPAKINPQVPCDLVIDHSVVADSFGCPSALDDNMKFEFERNEERYSFLKWAQSSFENVRIVPPGQGICHQLNIENFASVVMEDESANADAGSDAAGRTSLAYFDTVVGTDSHTPTANGIGVLGWGVGGIEAEAAALGQPITTLVPRVIGVKLLGKLADGVQAMDVALTFAQVLRERGVVGCFVECFGPGLAELSATQRACISNMTPEYGSTCTLFPIDRLTLDFLRMTGRDETHVQLVEAYAKAQGLWHDEGAQQRMYAEVVELDLGAIRPSMSGPSRPHDRFDIASGKERFTEICSERGLSSNAKATVSCQGVDFELSHGAIAIAAITSCTTATDPRMMLTCGLVAQAAARMGLQPKPWVKTVFAPGSHATQLLLKRAGLLDGLQKLGFATCGFGCMSCIGNSGPVLPQMHDVCERIELASVLSGNRNFEGRISPDVSQNYLMTPAAVVAYALAGTVDFNMETEPLGSTASGADVYLRDLWPDAAQVEELVERFVDSSLYSEGSAGLYDGDEKWRSLHVESSDLFAWNEKSTYVRAAPYFTDMTLQPQPPDQVRDAHVLALLGDFITTSLFAPADALLGDSTAGD